MLVQLNSISVRQNVNYENTMISNKKSGSKVLFLGITFKQDCPDIRNSRVVDIYK